MIEILRSLSTLILLLLSLLVKNNHCCAYGFVLNSNNHHHHYKQQLRQQERNQISRVSFQTTGKNDDNSIRSKRSNGFLSHYSYLSSSSLLLSTITTIIGTDRKDQQNNKLHNLKFGIVGGGPSGLLLAHGLMQHGAIVHIYEKRNRPKDIEFEQRAYALGVGLRGRTAIQKIDNTYQQNNNNNNQQQSSLWDSIKSRGYQSERFILHVGPLSLRLRDENDSIADNNNNILEPSLLLFQSDLCRSLIDELENRWLHNNNDRLIMNFNCEINQLDLKSKTISYINNNNIVENEQYDIIVGCDGVNSIVRQSMIKIWSPKFTAQQELLSGYLKVVRLVDMPPLLDPSAVQLLIPSKGSVTCFVEPTATNCCLLFAGGSSRSSSSTTGSNDNENSLNEPNDDLLMKSYDINNESKDQYDIILSNITIELQERYPKLIGCNSFEIIAKQLLEQEPTQASKVQCNNIFHCNHNAVLIGDAAHATGGVSGQGVNSALQDSVYLIDSLIQYYDDNNKENSIQKSLLQYSKITVPEAKALYDLSFGPIIKSPILRIQYTIKNIIDTLFKGKYGIGERPLNTLLTTSKESFATIRRQRQKYYMDDNIFPSQNEWDNIIETLDTQMSTSTQQ